MNELQKYYAGGAALAGIFLIITIVIMVIGLQDLKTWEQETELSAREVLAGKVFLWAMFIACCSYLVLDMAGNIAKYRSE